MGEGVLASRSENESLPASSLRSEGSADGFVDEPPTVGGELSEFAGMVGWYGVAFGDRWLE